MKTFVRFLLFLCFLLAFPHGAALSESRPAPAYRFHTEWVKLSSIDGRTLTPPVEKNISMAVLWLIPSDGHYTYAHDSRSGIPLNVTALTDGAPLPSNRVQIRYTQGRRTVTDGGAVSYQLHGATPVFLLFCEQEKHPVSLDVSLLACTAQHCQPVHERILLPPPPTALENAAQKDWFPELLASKAASEASETQTLAPASASITMRPSASLPHAGLLPEAHTSVFQKKASPAASQALPAPAAEVLPVPNAYTFAPQALEGSFQVDGWLRAIWLGLIAGLLLNFMPCVLPVLTMKFSVLLSTEGDLAERRRNIRLHALYFAAGIVVWFALLALLSGLTGMLWGQLFQSTEVIFFMLLIVFCMALSMFDVFHLPVLDLQPQHIRSPRTHAFSTGMFTTLLATPCSGPLLGGVLAWGITKPLPVLMTVFAATGIGMALPYMVIATFPQLVRFLPRPGAWLSVMERVLGLLLMATAIYLFSMLPPDLHVKTLITLLVAATSAWIWGRWGSLRGSITRRMFLGSFAVGAIALSTFWAFLPPQQETVPWIPFSEKEFRADLGKKAMIVEFTADWCPTCKVLERTTLAAPNLLPILDQYSVTPVKVDMTFKNEAQQDLLKALNSASIPLLAVFPEGEGASRPVILRDIYTVTDLHLALRQAKIPHKRMVEMLYPVKLLSQPKN